MNLYKSFVFRFGDCCTPLHHPLTRLIFPTSKGMICDRCLGGYALDLKLISQIMKSNLRLGGGFKYFYVHPDPLCGNHQPRDLLPDNFQKSKLLLSPTRGGEVKRYTVIYTPPLKTNLQYPLSQSTKTGCVEDEHYDFSKLAPTFSKRIGRFPAFQVKKHRIFWCRQVGLALVLPPTWNQKIMENHRNTPCD